MMAARKAFIFDIDGVLVDPKGYRKAVQATQAYFTHAMGLSDRLLVDDGIYGFFEACRVTSEWDMVPLALAILLEEILAKHPELNRHKNLEDCIRAIRRIPPDHLPNKIDYVTPIQAFSTHLTPGNYPAYQVLKLAQPHTSGLEGPRSSEFPIFPALAQTPLLEILLGHTRDIEQSPTTRLFQQFSLGSKAFKQTYELSPDVQTSSYLLENDQPLLPKPLSQTLFRHYLAEELALCAYTMRPSLPPIEVQTDNKQGYSPEAEMGLKLVSLTDIPLIGYGRIHYLAQHAGLPTENMLKPSPLQAIAAILAAISRNELYALQTALKVQQGKKGALDSLFLADEINVHVFEDSTGGIVAMQLAAEILAQFGLIVKVQPYGISNHPEKEAALRGLDIPIFRSTEQAVNAAMSAEAF
jgi:hypothetical protein